MEHQTDAALAGRDQIDRHRYPVRESLGGGYYIVFGGADHGLWWQPPPKVTKDGTSEAQQPRRLTSFVAWRSACVSKVMLDDDGHEREDGDPTYEVEIITAELRRHRVEGLSVSDSIRPELILARSGVQLGVLSADFKKVLLIAAGMRSAAEAAGMEQLNKTQIESAMGDAARYYDHCPTALGIVDRPGGWVIDAERLGVYPPPSWPASKKAASARVEAPSAGPTSSTSTQPDPVAAAVGAYPDGF
ncbi:MAG: hypothetical protein M3Y91_15840 [Actinomycetota bacterium]|nr:hypothetical protein [Actinomycetota bacterium]